jgi:hypothetical protein
MQDESGSVASEFELMLARAFVLAWDDFVAIEGEAVDTPEYRGALAARIVVLAKLGEPDETRISAAALTYLRALVAAKKLARAGWQAAATPSPAAGAVLDQEAIAAAATAYDSCLDELPEGISATARSALLQAILANAGKGERDSERLRLFALAALSSRR